ncbi:MAG: pantoate--beta-alanine ligase [Candidatus Gastranaerophilales bacterium]|nr:pantoate--beta-alanine ligase [Candidatus Gastranaerophilales bacterium]
MKTISKISEIRNEIIGWKKNNFVVGLVPTMGALHIGHESLIKQAKDCCDKVVVSIFVNPIQFGPNEDYNIYPRNLEKDQEICKRNGVDIIFHPEPAEIYPENEHLTIVTPPEFYKNKLCGITRAGHFEGVSTVVLKLFNIVQPDKAFFGQKDAQQIVIIKKICRDLNVPVEIVGCPIIRDNDGLAVSSRNQFLSSEARQQALSLHRILQVIVDLYKSGSRQKCEIFTEALKELSDEVELEYLDAYDAETLDILNKLKSNTLVAIAARVGRVRLIDNIVIN